MLKELRARVHDGKIVLEQSCERPPEGAEVIVVYESGTRTAVARRSPYGLWKDAFGRSVDIDAELRALRAQSSARLGDVDG
jgi:hypothetical protein